MTDRDLGEPRIKDILVGLAVTKFKRQPYRRIKDDRVEPYTLAMAADDAVEEAVRERSLNEKDVFDSLTRGNTTKPRDLVELPNSFKTDSWEEFRLAASGIILERLVEDAFPQLAEESEHRLMHADLGRT